MQEAPPTALTFPLPPPVDPEVLLALAIVGAVTGAVSMMTTFLAIRGATAVGGRLSILPELAPFFRQGAS